MREIRAMVGYYEQHSVKSRHKLYYVPRYQISPEGALTDYPAFCIPSVTMTYSATAPSGEGNNPVSHFDPLCTGTDFGSASVPETLQ